MEFKDRIKELRKEKGLTAEQVANEFGKSVSAVRTWEVGRTKPDADTLIGLSKYFGCTVDYLLGLSEFKSEEEADETEQGMIALLDYVLSFKYGKNAIQELFFLMKYAVTHRDTYGTQVLENFLFYVVSIGSATRSVDSAKNTPFNREVLDEYLSMLGTVRGRIDKAQKVAEIATSKIYRSINSELASVLEENLDESDVKTLLQAIRIIQQDDVNSDNDLAKELIRENKTSEQADNRDKI